MSLQNIQQQLSLNWKSALAVALVSVPLSLSLGIASGAGPVAGIVAAVWAGLIAGIVGGSQFNIVGPAGALSGILASFALVYGPSILPVIALLAGIMILFVWLMGWDKYLIFVPASVVHGFTLGVALTIGFGQLNFALGISGIPVYPHLFQNIFASLSHLSLAHWQSVLVFAVSLTAMFGLARLKTKIPNTVIVAVLGIVFGVLTTKGIIAMSLPTLFTKYGALSLSLFSIPRIAMSMITLAVVQNAAVVAFVIILETLLSAKVADSMTKTKFQQRKEVLGVGLANIVTGMFGGVPASGVFARTSINVQAGATSQWSQILNAGFVAVIALICLPYFAFIPLATIAAILVFAAIRMIKVSHFTHLKKYDPVALYIAFGIAIVTGFTDATTGIVLGALVSLFIFAYRASVGYGRVEKGDDTTTYALSGSINYLNAKSYYQKLVQLSDVRPRTKIIIDVSQVFAIDADGVEVLHELVEYFGQTGQEFAVVGNHEDISHALHTITA